MSRIYSSKPFAEIEDASCLRSGCHSARLLQGRVVSEKGIKFDHTAHILETRRGRQLKCASCHSQIVVGKHVEVTYDTCYLCHFKGRGEGKNFEPLGGCLGCHDLPQESFKIGNMEYNHKDFVIKQGVACQNCHMEVVRGTGEAPQERCFTCHNQPEKLAKYEDIPFIHENHVTKHNVACFHCHQEIRHGFGEGEGSNLASLDSKKDKHPPTLAFECSYCHQDKHAGQLEMYSGKVASLGLPEMPSPMYSAHVDCVGCHYDEKSDSGPIEFRGKTFKASEDSCIKCHGKEFKGIWEETRKELNEVLTPLKQKLSLVEKSAQNASKELKDKIAESRRLFDFVWTSHGEHNIYLSAHTLKKVDDHLSEVGEKLNLALPDLSNLSLLSGGFCATLCHQTVGVQVPPETVKAETFGGMEMPHKFHTTLMGCVRCHEIGAHKEVPLKKDHEKVCGECH